MPALLPTDDVDELLLAYEKAEGIELNPQQWEAVHLAATMPFVLITGGAGVGKTTVLKALYDVYDRAGIAVTQLALAGRAAKRMQEALEFVRDQFRHCKTMLALGAGRVLLERAGIPTKEGDGGLLIEQKPGKQAVQAFIDALARHRHPERETDPPAV